MTPPLTPPLTLALENEFNSKFSSNPAQLYYSILQNIIINWDNFKDNKAIQDELNPEKNFKTQEYRKEYPEESDKLIRARSLAFTLFIYSTIIN